MANQKVAKQNHNPRFPIYQKTKKDKKSYFWVSVSGTDAQDDTIYANLFVRMSKKASKKFKDNAEATNNASIKKVYGELTSYWLKAVEGGSYNNVILFINDFDVIDDDGNATKQESDDSEDE